jgi:diacylglycerol kinase (ATP)
MTRNERILIILNPSSGVLAKDTAASFIFRKLRKHFNTVCLVNSNSPSHGYDLTRQLMEQFDIITAFGGDGTINSIASALVGTDKTLGILPGGSGNGLARNLDIPISWKQAIDVLINGTDSYMDAGKINDRLFFNIAGIGFDALVTKKFNLESSRRGVASYVYYSLKEYFEYPSFQVRIQTGESTIDEEIFILAFANFRQYGSKAIIAPFASPTDNLLDMCIVNKFSLLKESLYISNLFKGTIHKFPSYKTFKFIRCEITSLRGPIPYHFDGEYGGEDLTHYTVEVIPSCIKIKIPIK